jgi:hypothetical protein
MAKVQVQVEVSKESYELGDAVASIVASIKEKAEGGLTAAEIAQALTENVSKIMVGLSGAEQMGEEFKADPEASIAAGMLVGKKVLGAFIKKPAPAPAA